MKDAFRTVLGVEADSISLDPQAYTLDELRQVVFDGGDRLPKELALSVLRLKDYPESEKVADFQRVLQNEQESPRIRYAAAVELGRIASTTAAIALESGLETDNNFVLEGVISQLSQLREELNLPKTSQLAVERTRMTSGLSVLLAYKENTPGVEIQFPQPTAFLPLQHSSEVSIVTADTQEAARAVSQLGNNCLNLNLIPERAIFMQCGGRNLLFLPNQEVTEREALQRLLIGKMIVGIVAVQYTTEIEKWSPKYYVLTQSLGSDRNVQILLATTDGLVAFAGSTRIDDTGIVFTLRTVAHPGAVPVEIEGIYEQGTIRLNRIRSDSQRQGMLEPSVRR